MLIATLSIFFYIGKSEFKRAHVYLYGAGSSNYLYDGLEQTSKSGQGILFEKLQNKWARSS